MMAESVRAAGAFPASALGGFTAFPIAAAAGFLSTLINPCAIPLYATAGRVCCGMDSHTQRAYASPKKAIAFELGVATSIAILGLGAAAAGRVLTAGPGSAIALALVLILMGTSQLGWIRIPRPKINLKWFHPHLSSAFVTGLFVSLIVGVCGTPILAAVLAYTAYHRAFVYGGFLLLSYGIGSGLPLVVFGTTIGSIASRLNRGSGRRIVNSAFGAFLLLGGFYMLIQL